VPAAGASPNRITDATHETTTLDGMAEAVVIPGGGSGVTTGMLWYAGEVAARRGATVHRHTWTEPVPATFDATVETWVTAQVAPRLTGRPLLIGKSLGSMAAPLAADRDLPAVWLTQSLHFVPRCVRGALS
jgi:hypothetical protein